MPRALVTGITGQDGSYLAEKLLALGWEVHGIARSEDPLVHALHALAPNATLHAVDLAHAEAVGTIVESVSPHYIYNLGGISSVAFSWQEPLMTAEITGLSVAALLESAWKLQERTQTPIRFLQASSAEIFGNAALSPQNELTPIRPTTPYGAAKAFAHHLVGVYRTRGMHASTCILYNHESPRRPPTFVTRKITSTVAAIAKGSREKLTLGNMDARRDWGWAPDYVDALLAATSHDVADDYVIATGKGHSVQDFAAAAFAHIGIEDWEAWVSVDAGLGRPGDAPELIGDASKAQAVLGWEPSISFEELVARMVEHDLKSND